MTTASMLRKGSKKIGSFLSEKVTTVPPTRDVPTRVVTEYSPAKYSMFWNDKKNRVYHELHATLRGSKVTTTEGVCGEPLTETVRDYGSAAAAKDNDEGSFEAVITPSVDAFMWGLVHRTAVEHGSYDAKAFEAGLKKLGIKRELAMKR